MTEIQTGPNSNHLKMTKVPKMMGFGYQHFLLFLQHFQEPNEESDCVAELYNFCTQDLNSCCCHFFTKNKKCYFYQTKKNGKLFEIESIFKQQVKCDSNLEPYSSVCSVQT